MRDHLDRLLGDVEHYRSRRMFGGFGLFYRDVMFAIIHDDTVYLKTDEATRPAFEAAGVGHFEYHGASGTRGMRAYRRLPEAVLDDETRFRDWCEQAMQAALRAGPARKRSRRKQG